MEELQVQAKKTFSRLGWCYTVGTIVMNLSQSIIMILLKRYRPELISDINVMLIISCITVDMLTLPLIYLMVRNMPKTLPEKHNPKWWEFPIVFIICYSMVFLSNIAGNIVTFIVALYKRSPVDNNLISYVTGGNVWMNLLFMVIIAPIMEELVFRKVLVDRTVQYGQGVAIALSGLMFGLFHGNFNQFAYAVVLGALFAFIYIKTGDIKVTIILHAVINFMGSVIAGGLLKMIHYEELLNLDLTDTALVMRQVTEHLAGWILYLVYLLFILCTVIGGIVCMIVFRRKFRVDPGADTIPKGQRIQTMLLNPGMIVFCVVWVFMILMQLLA